MSIYHTLAKEGHYGVLAQPLSYCVLMSLGGVKSLTIKRIMEGYQAKSSFYHKESILEGYRANAVASYCVLMSLGGSSPPLIGH